MTEAATAVLAAAAEARIGQVIALTDPDNISSQAVAARLGMRNEGITQRWYGLTSRQYHKVIVPSGDGPFGLSPRTYPGDDYILDYELSIPDAYQEVITATKAHGSISLAVE